MKNLEKPDQTRVHEIYVGTATGSFKRHISFSNQTTDLRKIAKLKEGDEILHLIWSNDEKTEILFGQTNGQVKSFKLDSSKFRTHRHISLEEKAKIVGLGTIDNRIITGVDSGVIKIWDENDSDSIEIQTGTHLERIYQNKYNVKQIASGGNENLLKLWDLESQKNLFTAKNIPNDMLQLRVPVWVCDIRFLSENVIVTASRYGNVCAYDTRAQRRPVMRLETEDSAYSCLSTTCEENTVVVGGGKGIMHMIDIKNPGKILHKYKGFSGGIKSVQCDEEKPFVISCSLDRRLRIHNLHTTQLLDEAYLKSRLNCVLVKALDIKSEEEIEEIATEDNKESISKEISDSEEMDDILIENSNIYDEPNFKEEKKTDVESKKRKTGKSKKKNKKIKISMQTS